MRIVVVDSGPLITLFYRDDTCHVPVFNFLRKHLALWLISTGAVLAAQTGISQVLTLDRDFDIYRDARGKRLKNLLATIFARSR